jgi:hypothetical protein
MPSVYFDWSLLEPLQPPSSSVVTPLPPQCSLISCRESCPRNEQLGLQPKPQEPLLQIPAQLPSLLKLALHILTVLYPRIPISVSSGQQEHCAMLYLASSLYHNLESVRNQKGYHGTYLWGITVLHCLLPSVWKLISYFFPVLLLFIAGWLVQSQLIYGGLTQNSKCAVLGGFI